MTLTLTIAKSASAMHSAIRLASGNYWAIHATRTDPSDEFLTGVAFKDANGNGRFDLNEGLAGVTITAGTHTTTTNAAGGWSIKAPNGRSQVKASGGAFQGQGSVPVKMNGSNVEVDFVSGVSSGYLNFESVDPTSKPASLKFQQVPTDGTAGSAGHRIRQDRRRCWIWSMLCLPPDGLQRPSL